MLVIFMFSVTPKAVTFAWAKSRITPHFCMVDFDSNRGISEFTSSTDSFIIWPWICTGNWYRPLENILPPLPKVKLTLLFSGPLMSFSIFFGANSLYLLNHFLPISVLEQQESIPAAPSASAVNVLISVVLMST